MHIKYFEIPKYTNVKFISIILILLQTWNVLINVATCAKIQPNGGYDLVFAIAKGTVEPQNVTDFLINIDNNLKNFSSAVHVATGGRFFVNSVDVIVPYHWEHWDPTQFGTGMDEKITATWQNYEKADVRLSKDVAEPQVENPNFCGLPGEFIQLPLEFFEDNQKFGPPHKALLNAFARYRFGTHEEFGYPEDERFPYFYKNSSVDPLWKAVGCFNGNLTGEYVSQSQSSECILDDLTPPEADCRFIPEIDDENGDEPTSSISYLPWLDSVVEFCDENTHNFDAPTKQNIHCGYKSIQQVLENSPDFQSSSVKDVDTELTEMIFNVKVATKHPIFYLLVDTGRFNIPEEFVDKIILQVKALLEDEKFADIISAAGVFNSRDLGVQQKVEWARMGDKIQEFKSVVDEFKSQNDSPGNFAVALEQVVTMIRAHNHAEGAIILVLKHGASSRDFGKSAYESNLLAILQQEKINLHAIEIEFSMLNPQVHLKALAEQSGGFHSIVSSRTPEVEAVAQMARRKIEANLEAVTDDKLTGTLFKGFLPNQLNFSVPFHQASLPVDTQIVFSLTLTDNQIILDPKSQLISLVDGPENAPQLVLDSIGFEWDEKLNGGNRKTVKYTMKMPRNNFAYAWVFSYDGYILSDESEFFSPAFLLISYSLPLDTIQIPGSNLQVSVWISPQLDQSSSLSALSMPLTIFAKILQNGSPLSLNTKEVERGGDRVIATLHSFDKAETLPLIFLEDDGASSIDIAQNDGIYSGILSSIPANINGEYRLTVEIRGEKVTTETDEEFLFQLQNHKDSAIHRLLPRNPLEHIGCPSSQPECHIVGLERSSVVLVDYPLPIAIKSDDFKTRAARITNLHADSMSNYQIQLSWHEPGIIMHEDLQGLITFEYEIRTSALPIDLKTLGGFESATLVPLPDEEKDEINSVYFDTTTLKQVTVNGTNNGTQMYFAIRLNLTHPTESGRIQLSDPSNVVPVEIPELNSTTTPSTTIKTTTNTPITKNTTTTLPTTDDELGLSSTTAPDDDDKYWYEKVEAIITFSVFGAAMLIMMVALLAYCTFSKKKRPATNHQANHPYNSF